MALPPRTRARPSNGRADSDGGERKPRSVKFACTMEKSAPHRVLAARGWREGGRRVEQQERRRGEAGSRHRPGEAIYLPAISSVCNVRKLLRDARFGDAPCCPSRAGGASPGAYAQSYFRSGQPARPLLPHASS